MLTSNSITEGLEEVESELSPGQNISKPVTHNLDPGPPRASLHPGYAICSVIGQQHFFMDFLH